MLNRYPNILGSSNAAKKIEQDNKQYLITMSNNIIRSRESTTRFSEVNKYNNISYINNTLVHTRYSSNINVIESIIK